MTDEVMWLVIDLLALISVCCLLLGINLNKDWISNVGVGIAVLAILLCLGGMFGLYQDPEPVQLVCKLIDGDYYCKY